MLRSKSRDSKDPKNADDWLRKARVRADEIDFQAARAYPVLQSRTAGEDFFFIGGTYEDGDGLPQVYSEAVAWMRLGAQKGDINAEAKLGTMYAAGNGVPQDFPQAVLWLRKAAERGHSDAEFNLAIQYLDGHGVVEDDSEAARWLRKAAERGIADAQLQLGNLYRTGHGVPKDYAEAYFWFDLAAARLSGSDQKLASDARDLMAEALTTQEISDAQRKATVWFAAHPPQH